jgi:hypothetical protein
VRIVGSEKLDKLVHIAVPAAFRSKGPTFLREGEAPGLGIENSNVARRLLPEALLGRKLEACYQLPD